MATYAVTAAKHENGKLIALQGQETHGHVASASTELSTEVCVFSIPKVLELIEDGDNFHLLFRSSGALVGAGLIIPDGSGSLTEEQCIPGRRISDLPSF